MRTNVCVVGLCLAAFLLPVAAAKAEQDVSGDTNAPAGWRLVWHDEFDGTEVDTTKWTVETRDLMKNNELEVYEPDDVFVRDGCLVLRSRKRESRGRHYTSGLVDSRHKFFRRYGRFEIRAKLPKGKGVWPAHWLLPQDSSWPPEIDIMEMLGHKPNRIIMTYHFRGEDGKPAHTGWSYVGKEDFSKDFHSFALEWRPESLTWFIDGKKRHFLKRPTPDKPFFIILNTAVGGILPGNPDETTEFPQEHLVDYVRVYEAVEPASK